MSEHRMMCVWKFNAFACVSIIRGHTDWVEVIASNPKSSLGFVSAGADSIVRRYAAPSTSVGMAGNDELVWLGWREMTSWRGWDGGK